MEALWLSIGRSRFFRAFGLVAIVLVVYSAALRNGFVWDDDALITANPVIQGPLRFSDIWTSVHADDCPLTLSAFWAMNRIWGNVPLPYHAGAVLAHAVSAVILWLVLNRLRVPGAWFGAVLWAVHPVNVESVAWASELKNGLSGIFFLLALFFFMRWLEGLRQESRRADYAGTLLCVALAMAAKASASVLPAVMALYWWTMKDRSWRDLLRVLAPTAAMAAISGVATALAGQYQMAGLMDHDLRWQRPFVERLITAGLAVWFYAGKLLWPHPLMSFYPRWPVDPHDPTQYLAPVAVVGMAVALHCYRRKIGRWPMFVYGCFVICLLPVLGLVDLNVMRYSFVYDHYQYLASMAAIPFCAALIFAMAERIGGASGTRVARVTCAIATIPLIALTIGRIPAYADEQSLSRDAAMQNPNSWIAWYDLGRLEVNGGKPEQGIPHLQKVIALNPTYPNARDMMGVALAEQGRVAEAVEQFQKAVEIAPDWLDARMNLGVAFANEEHWPEAAREFERALRIAPGNATATAYLGAARARMGPAVSGGEAYSK